MSKLALLSLFLLFSCLTLASCHKRIYYLYQDEAEQDHLTVETLKQNRENHPVHKIDWYLFRDKKQKVQLRQVQSPTLPRPHLLERTGHQLQVPLSHQPWWARTLFPVTAKSPAQTDSRFHGIHHSGKLGINKFRSKLSALPSLLLPSCTLFSQPFSRTEAVWKLLRAKRISDALIDFWFVSDLRLYAFLVWIFILFYSEWEFPWKIILKKRPFKNNWKRF